MKKEKICPICEQGKLIPVEDIISEIEGYVFVEKGERCTNCGEEFISEKEGQKMIGIARKLGIWGEPLKLYRKLSKSARGTILRIPTDIEKNLKIKGGERVAISKIGTRKIMIEIL
jgi:ribosomal protein S27AE